MDGFDPLGASEINKATRQSSVVPAAAAAVASAASLSAVDASRLRIKQKPAAAPAISTSSTGSSGTASGATDAQTVLAASDAATRTLAPTKYHPVVGTDQLLRATVGAAVRSSDDPLQDLLAPPSDGGSGAGVFGSGAPSSRGRPAAALRGSASPSETSAPRLGATSDADDEQVDDLLVARMLATDARGARGETASEAPIAGSRAAELARERAHAARAASAAQAATEDADALLDSLQREESAPARATRGAAVAAPAPVFSAPAPSSAPPTAEAIDEELFALGGFGAGGAGGAGGGTEFNVDDYIKQFS